MAVKQIIPEIIVDNIKSMIYYYEHYFDFVLDFTDVENENFTWAQMSNGTCVIMFQEIESTKNEITEINKRITGTDLLMFKFDSTEDVKKLYDRFDTIKDTIYMEFHNTDYGTCEFGVKDPEGRYIIVSG